jgi:flagellar motor protein MotB
MNAAAPVGLQLLDAGAEQAQPAAQALPGQQGQHRAAAQEGGGEDAQGQQALAVPQQDGEKQRQEDQAEAEQHHRQCGLQAQRQQLADVLARLQAEQLQPHLDELDRVGQQLAHPRQGAFGACAHAAPAEALGPRARLNDGPAARRSACRRRPRRRWRTRVLVHVVVGGVHRAAGARAQGGVSVGQLLARHRQVLLGARAQLGDAAVAVTGGGGQQILGVGNHAAQVGGSSSLASTAVSAISDRLDIRGPP